MVQHDSIRRSLAEIPFRRKDHSTIPLRPNLAEISRRCLNWSKSLERLRTAIIFEKMKHEQHNAQVHLARTTVRKMPITINRNPLSQALCQTLSRKMLEKCFRKRKLRGVM